MTETPATIHEKIDFVLRRVARVDGIANALWFMARSNDTNSALKFNLFRDAVEVLSALQDEATTGVYDALHDIDNFVNSTSCEGDT